jgi:hypothetical protein
MATAIGHTRWPKFLLAFAGITAFVWTVAHRTAGTAPVPVPGWDGLFLCSDVASLDGAKELMLDENHLARLYGGANSKNIAEGEQGRSIDGEWSFNETLKRYAITLNGVTTVYSVVQPENSHMCLLIKGDLNSANLRESWFSLDLEDINDTSARYER